MAVSNTSSGVSVLAFSLMMSNASYTTLRAVDFLPSHMSELMNFSTRCEPYLRSTPGMLRFFTGLRIQKLELRIRNYELLPFWCFRAVTRAAHAALVQTGGVEFAAHYLVADVDVLHAAGAHDDHRVLLEVVALAGDVGGNLLAVGQAHAGDFADGGVRFAGRGGGHLGADPALKGRRVEDRAVFERVESARQRGRLGFGLKLCASFADELGKSCHLKTKRPEGVSTNLYQMRAPVKRESRESSSAEK